MVILLIRASQKLTLQQNRLRRNWVPEQLSGLLTHATGSHPGFSDLWRSPPVLSSTLVTFGCVVFLIVQASSFFIHSPFLTQSIRLPLVTYLSLLWLMGHYAMAAVTRCFPCNPYLGKQKISPRGGKHSKHVPLLTYLAWLQPVIYNLRLIFKHVKN